MASEVIIENKTYVIIPKERYEYLTKQQVYKKYKDQLLSVEEAKERTLERIKKWEKSI